MRIVLGIDGGGTGTRAVIVSERGEVLASGQGGVANMHHVGVDATITHILDAEREARAGLAAELKSQPLDAAFIGLAGVGSEADRARLSGLAGKLHVVSPDRVMIDSDLRVAHAGALAGREGVVIIAGTGSSCFGVNERGEMARAGGWGPLFDDAGSALDIVRQAIIETIRAEDGRREHGPLTREMKAALGDDFRKVVTTLRLPGEDRARLAALAPIVFACSQRGDVAALRIVRAAVDELALAGSAVARKLDLPTDASVAVTGGLTRAGSVFLDPFDAALARCLPQARRTRAVFSSEVGAALLALESIGVKADDALRQRLNRGGESRA